MSPEASAHFTGWPVALPWLQISNRSHGVWALQGSSWVSWKSQAETLAPQLTENLECYHGEYCVGQGAAVVRKVSATRCSASWPPDPSASFSFPATEASVCSLVAMTDFFQSAQHDLRGRILISSSKLKKLSSTIQKHQNSVFYVYIFLFTNVIFFIYK